MPQNGTFYVFKSLFLIEYVLSLLVLNTFVPKEKLMSKLVQDIICRILQENASLSLIFAKVSVTGGFTVFVQNNSSL